MPCTCMREHRCHVSVRYIFGRLLSGCKDKPNPGLWGMSCSQLAGYCSHSKHGALVTAACRVTCKACKPSQTPIYSADPRRPDPNNACVTTGPFVGWKDWEGLQSARFYPHVYARVHLQVDSHVCPCDYAYCYATYMCYMSCTMSMHMFLHTSTHQPMHMLGTNFGLSTLWVSMSVHIHVHTGKCLSRKVDWNLGLPHNRPLPSKASLLKLITDHDKYPPKCENGRIESCHTKKRYGRDRGFRFSLMSGPHGLPHNAAGGHMTAMRSPMDPIFFSHHAYVDKNWATWQA